MKSLFSVLFLLSFYVSQASIQPPTKTAIDLSMSKIEWIGYKVLGKHNGFVQFKSGELVFENDILVGGSFIVDMSTIDCQDLSGGGKGKLEGHLKSNDFFGVDQFPTAALNIKKVVSRGKVGEYKVIADVTIKGITKEIKFDAMLNNGIGSADIKIDRSDFDIRYGSGSFFDNLGDKTIYDEFDLKINLKY